MSLLAIYLPLLPVSLQPSVVIHGAGGKGHLGKGALSTEHMLHHRGLYSILTPFGAHMHVAEGERLKGLTTNDGRAIWKSSRYRRPVGGTGGEMDERLDQRMDGGKNRTSGESQRKSAYS